MITRMRKRYFLMNSPLQISPSRLGGDREGRERGAAETPTETNEIHLNGGNHGTYVAHRSFMTGQS